MVQGASGHHPQAYQDAEGVTEEEPMSDLPEPLPDWCAPHVIRVDPGEHEEAPRDRSLAPAQFVYYVRADAYEKLQESLMSKDIPPAGTPVDQKLYNEACRKVADLERRIAQRDKWNDALEKTVLELAEQRDELQDKIDECAYDRCPCR